MSEKELVELCSKRDTKAQHLLYDLYHERLLGICMRYGKSTDEAEDILQMGMLKIFKNIGSFSGKGSLEGWMKRVMVNVAIDNFRKNSKFYYHEDVEEMEDLPFLESEALDYLAVDDIMATIQKLPDGYRIVFNLFALEGFSHQEIAKNLGISVSTSKTQLLRARRNLMKQLAHLNHKSQKTIAL